MLRTHFLDRQLAVWQKPLSPTVTSWLCAQDSTMPHDSCSSTGSSANLDLDITIERGFFGRSLVGLAVGRLVEAILANSHQLVGCQGLEVGRHLVDPGLDLLCADGVWALVAGLVHQVPCCSMASTWRSESILRLPECSAYMNMNVGNGIAETHNNCAYTLSETSQLFCSQWLQHGKYEAVRVNLRTPRVQRIYGINVANGKAETHNNSAYTLSGTSRCDPQHLRGLLVVSE